MAGEYAFPKSDGDLLYDGDTDALNGVVRAEAGETVAVGEVVYIKRNTGEVWKGDTGTADDIRADGIALDNGNDGDTVRVLTKGIYTEAATFTAKEVYYLGANGALSTTASEVEIGVAESTDNLFVNIVQDDRDKVGTIKAIGGVTGTTANYTAFWQLCDGTTVSDAESPLNGQAIPDYNADGRFLQGADAAGGTGGAAAMAHTHTITPDGSKASYHGVGAGYDDSVSVPLTSSAASNTENRPPFVSVIWIMKKK